MQAPIPFPCKMTQEMIITSVKSRGFAVPENNISELAQLACTKPDCRRSLDCHSGIRVPNRVEYTWRPAATVVAPTGAAIPGRTYLSSGTTVPTATKSSIHAAGDYVDDLEDEKLIERDSTVLVKAKTAAEARRPLAQPSVRARDDEDDDDEEDADYVDGEEEEEEQELDADDQAVADENAIVPEKSRSEKKKLKSALKASSSQSGGTSSSHRHSGVDNTASSCALPVRGGDSNLSTSDLVAKLKPKKPSASSAKSAVASVAQTKIVGSSSWSNAGAQSIGTVDLDEVPDAQSDDWFVTEKDMVSETHPGEKCIAIHYYGDKEARKDSTFLMLLYERNKRYKIDEGMKIMIMNLLLQVVQFQDHMSQSNDEEVSALFHGLPGSMLASTSSDSLLQAFFRPSARVTVWHLSERWEKEMSMIEDTRRLLLTFDSDIVNYETLWNVYQDNIDNLPKDMSRVFPPEMKSKKKAKKARTSDAPKDHDQDRHDDDDDDESGGGGEGKQDDNPGVPPQPRAAASAAKEKLAANTKKRKGRKPKDAQEVKEKETAVVLYKAPSFNYPDGWKEEFNRVRQMSFMTMYSRPNSNSSRPVLLYSMTDAKVMAIRALMNRFGVYDCGRTRHLSPLEKLVLHQLCPAKNQDVHIRFDMEVITVSDVKEEYMISCPICTIPYCLHPARSVCDLPQSQVVRILKAKTRNVYVCYNCGCRLASHKGKLNGNTSASVFSGPRLPLLSYVPVVDRSVSDPGNVVDPSVSRSGSVRAYVIKDERLLQRTPLPPLPTLPPVASTAMDTQATTLANFCIISSEQAELAYERVIQKWLLDPVLLELCEAVPENDEYDACKWSNLHKSIPFGIVCSPETFLLTQKVELENEFGTFSPVDPVVDDGDLCKSRWTSKQERKQFDVGCVYRVNDFVTSTGITFEDYVVADYEPVDPDVACLSYEVEEHTEYAEFGVLIDMGICVPELYQTCDMMQAAAPAPVPAVARVCNFYIEDITDATAPAGYSCIGCGNAVALGEHPHRPTAETNMERLNRDIFKAMRSFKPPPQSEFPMYAKNQDPTLHVEACNQKFELHGVFLEKRIPIFALTLELILRRWWNDFTKDSDLSWEEMMEEFVRYTQHHNRPDKLKDELENLRQSAGQTVMIYCSRYRHIAAQLKIPSNDASHIDRMVRGLVNRIRAQMRSSYSTVRAVDKDNTLPQEQVFATFQDAQKSAAEAEYALSLHTTDKHTPSHASEDKSKNSRSRPRARSLTFAPEVDEQQSSAAAKKLELDTATNTIKNTGNKKAEKRKGSDKKKSPTPSPASRIAGMRYYNDDKAAHKCGMCQVLGHNAQECTKNKADCRTCHKTGHILYDCPDEKAKRAKKDAAKRARGKRIVAWNGHEYKGSQLLITVVFDGEAKALTRVMVDSGAEFTFVSKQVAVQSGKLIKKPDKNEVQVLAGASRDFKGVKRIGYIYLTLTVHFPDQMKMGPITFRKKCEVVNCEDDIVLGMDTLPILFPNDLSLKTISGFSPITKLPTKVVFHDGKVPSRALVEVSIGNRGQQPSLGEIKAYDYAPAREDDEPDTLFSFTPSELETKQHEFQKKLMMEKLAPLIAINTSTSRGLFCTDPASVVTVTVLPENEKNIYRAQYALPHAVRPIVDKKVLSWYEEDKTELAPANCPFNNPILAAPKKDSEGKMKDVRVCEDVRLVNENQVENDRFEIPNIPSLLHSLAGGKLFGEFDLKEAYHQFLVHPNSRKYLAFTWAGVQYVWKACPFGLKHLPSFFQRYISGLFAGMPFVFPYLDNIGFSSKSWIEHFLHAKMILERLTSVNLRIKESAVNIGNTHMRLLGHIVCEQGILLDTEKKEMIAKWPLPSDGATLASALGLCAFMRDHIRHYADITAPLEAVKREKTLVWTPHLKLCWELLKKAFATAPLLRFPDLNKRLVIAADSSQASAGGVLYQPNDADDTITPYNIIAMCSKQYAAAQKNYPVYKKELWAIIYCLRKFHMYIWGRTDVILYTDHKPLIHILSQRNLTVALQQWLDVLLDYNLKIKYRPGILHIIPDALSRMYMSAYFDDSVTWGVHSNITFIRVAEENLSPSDQLCVESIEAIKPRVEVKRRHRDIKPTSVSEGGRKRGTNSQNQPFDVVENSSVPTMQLVSAASAEVKDEPCYLTSADRREFSQALVRAPLYNGMDPAFMRSIRRMFADSGLSEPHGTYDYLYNHIPQLSGARTREQKGARDKRAERYQLPPGLRAAPAPPTPPVPQRLPSGKDEVTEEEASSCSSSSSSSSPTPSPSMEEEGDNDEDAESTAEVESDTTVDSRPVGSSMAPSPAPETAVVSRPRQGAANLSYEEQLAIAQEKRGRRTPSIEKQKELVAKAHAAGHYGDQAMRRWIDREGFWWPRMGEDIRYAVQSCPECAKYNVGHHGYEPLQGVTAPRPGDHYQIDLGQMPTSLDGYTYILILVDVFTGFAIFRALQTNEGDEVAKVLWDIFCILGIPKILQMDNGSEFDNKVLQALNKRINVNGRYISEYNPRANGKVERMVGTAKASLKKMLHGQSGHWPAYLPYCQLAFNDKVRSLTGASAFVLMFGRRPNLPADYNSAWHNDIGNGHEQWLAHLDDVRRIIYPATVTRVEKQQLKYRERFNMKHRIIPKGYTIPVDSFVFVKDPKYVQPKSIKPTLEGTYIGPFRVIGMTPSNNYVLQDDTGDVVGRSVPIDQIKFYDYPGSKTDKEFGQYYPLEKILADKKDDKTNETLVLVKWKGYEEPWWIPTSHIRDTPILERYYKAKSTRVTKKSKKAAKKAQQSSSSSSSSSNDTRTLIPARATLMRALSTGVLVLGNYVPIPSSTLPSSL